MRFKVSLEYKEIYEVGLDLKTLFYITESSTPKTKTYALNMHSSHPPTPGSGFWFHRARRLVGAKPVSTSIFFSLLVILCVSFKLWYCTNILDRTDVLLTKNKYMFWNSPRLWEAITCRVGRVWRETAVIANQSDDREALGLGQIIQSFNLPSKCDLCSLIPYSFCGNPG